MGVRVDNPRGVKSFKGSYEAVSGLRMRLETRAALVVNKIVYPSFLALTTLSVPMVIPPPGRFTATIGTLSSLDNSSPIVRPATSVASPGARGITRLIALLGYICASIRVAVTMSNAIDNKLRIPRIIAAPFERNGVLESGVADSKSLVGSEELQHRSL